VVLAEAHFFGGNSVFIHHGDGLVSMYLHLDRIDVATGDEVDRAQTVGAVGSTGRATGPHLHFGLRWHGARVDPELLLESGRPIRALTP
jgi:murein DD-endopeptidase MepM/ murein hydrolase activator NlpD